MVAVVAVGARWRSLAIVVVVDGGATLPNHNLEARVAASSGSYFYCALAKNSAHTAMPATYETYKQMWQMCQMTP